ncbi:MAG TPA: hypothetical protein EYQ57_06000 [Methylococcaceae bacterium]|nr:hypothetical protein [Methylococcaceae bacterium]
MSKRFTQFADSQGLNNPVAALFFNRNKKQTDKFLPWLAGLPLLSSPLQCCKKPLTAIAKITSTPQTPQALQVKNHREDDDAK